MDDCLCVRKIRIIQSNTNEQRNGVLGVFEASNGSNAVVLHVVAQHGDGGGSYFQRTVTAESLRANDSSNTITVNKLKEYLGTKADGAAGDVETLFELANADEAVLLTIKVKQQTASGLVRELWSTTIEGSKDERSMFTFTLSLADCVSRERERASALQLRLDEVRQGRDDWKDTAEKLEGGWEKEKSVLLKNFLKLYNARQELQSSLTDKVSSLEQEKERLTEELARAATDSPKRQTRAPRRRKREIEEMNVPTDDDKLLFDDETVDRLAKGKRIEPPKAPALQKRASTKRPRVERSERHAEKKTVPDHAENRSGKASKEDDGQDSLMDIFEKERQALRAQLLGLPAASEETSKVKSSSEPESKDKKSLETMLESEDNDSLAVRAQHGLSSQETDERLARKPSAAAAKDTADIAVEDLSDDDFKEILQREILASQQKS